MNARETLNDGSDRSNLSDVEEHRSQTDSTESDTFHINFSHRKHQFDLVFSVGATVANLFSEVESLFEIPVTNQKWIVPKGPLLKGASTDPDTPLQPYEGKTLMLMGSGASEVDAVQKMASKVAKRNAARLAHRPRVIPRRDQARSTADARYTFLQVKPLNWLPRPQRSEAILLRLKEDPGIRAAMRKHKFTVALLTEMEPLANTQSSHEGTSRILGLNRNQGEVIELRLRTDEHDGYRDYKTIRKTLCHELAHNVHGPHDRNFWDLCHQIEREVDAADWKTSGHTIGESSRYTISGQTEEEEAGHEDHGGWTGGEFVLGGVADTRREGMSRRDVLAQAALERQKNEAEAEGKCVKAAEKGWRPCQRPRSNEEPQ